MSKFWSQFWSQGRLSPGTHNASFSIHYVSSKSGNAWLHYCDSINFQDGRRPPHWIFISACWTTHEDTLVVQDAVTIWQ